MLNTFIDLEKVRDHSKVTQIQVEEYKIEKRSKHEKQMKSESDLSFLKNRFKNRRNTTAANAQPKVVKSKTVLKPKASLKEMKLPSEPLKLQKKPFSRNNNQNKHKSIISPLKKEPKTTIITDSDSKRFFEEVFDDPNEFDHLLKDMPHIDEHDELDEIHDDFQSEIKREIQTMKQEELKNMLPKDLKIINASDDEDCSLDIGDEAEVGDHSYVPNPSMKTRTIRDINSSNKSRGMLSPIREND